MRNGENYIYVKLMFCGLQMCGPGTAPAPHKHIDLDFGQTLDLKAHTFSKFSIRIWTLCSCEQRKTMIFYFIVVGLKEKKR